MYRDLIMTLMHSPPDAASAFDAGQVATIRTRTGAT